jgi:hypothetical protein
MRKPRGSLWRALRNPNGVENRGPVAGPFSCEAIMELPAVLEA